MMPRHRCSRSLKHPNPKRFLHCFHSNMTALPLSLSPSLSCTRRCVSWLMSCRWTGRCGSVWTLWLVNLPKLQTKSCRCCTCHNSLSLFTLWPTSEDPVSLIPDILQVIVDSMVSLCRELCPLSASAAERLAPPLSSVSERVSVPRSAIRTALMERAAQDIHRALE